MNRIYISDSSFLTDENVRKKYLFKISKSRLERYKSYTTQKAKALTLGASLILNFKKEGEFYSISHSFPYALLAFSQKKVGADIEKIKDYNSDIPKRFFSKNEVLYIENQKTYEEKKKAFFSLWTLKESTAKLYGTPLIDALKKYEIIPDGNFFIKNNVFYSLHYTDGFIIAVASQSGYFEKLDSVSLIQH